MTFYYYALTETNASSLNYTKVLSVASGETTVATTRLGAQSKAVTTANSQALFVIRALGKGLTASASQTTTLARSVFASRFVVVGVASAQVARIVSPYLANASLSAGMPQSASLSFPRLYHAVVAASHTGTARLQRLSGHAVNGVQTAIQGLVRSVGRLNAATIFLPQATFLTRNTSLVRGIASTGVAQSVKSAGKIAATLLQSQTSTPQRAIGHLISLVSVSVLQAMRSLPVRLSAASGEAPRLAFGAAAYMRAFSIAEGQALAVGRGIFSLHGAQTAGPTALLKSSGRLLGVPASGIAALSRVSARLVGAASSNTAGAGRVIGLVRQIAAASSVAVQTAGSHLPAVLHAVQAQAAATQRLLTHSTQLSAQAVQASAAAMSLMLSFFRTATASLGQAAVVGRAIARSRGTAAPSAQALVRLAGRAFSLASPSAVLAVLQRLGLRQLAAASPNAAALIRAQSLMRAMASPQATAAVTQRGKLISVLSAASQGLARLTSKLMLSISVQAAASGRIDSKIVGTTSPSLATLARPHGLILRAAQTQAVKLVTWYWLYVAEWAYQQTTLLPPGGGLAEPPSFGPIDPADRTTFAFNWASRGDPNDAIVSATVTSLPPGLTFFGPAFISGALVEVIVVPSIPPQRPTTYNLRCSATFASGRRSSFSIPVPVRAL